MLNLAGEITIYLYWSDRRRGARVRCGIWSSVVSRSTDRPWKQCATSAVALSCCVPIWRRLW